MDLNGFSKVITRPSNVVITTHLKPDGDALGSSLGLYHLLQALGHTVHFISPTDFPMNFDWMPGRDKILIYGEEQTRSATLVEQANIICCLDFNHLKRIGDLGILIQAATGFKVMIDHHQDPQGFEDFALWDPNASSTCELVFSLACELNWTALIEKNIATCLYTGILTDTGSFRFPRTTAKVHRIVANLLDAGADNVFVHDRIYDQQSENRLRFLGYCLKDKLVLLKALSTAYFAISMAEFDRYDLETGDTEGIVNYALGIDSIKLAVLLIERPGKVKLSFRSKGDFPCNKFAAEHFSGGGHTNAAGGESSLSIEETLNKFKQVLTEYEQLLVI